MAFSTCLFQAIRIPKGDVGWKKNLINYFNFT
jgi:hypothetical protein